MDTKIEDNLTQITDIGASVLMEFIDAWDIDTLYPACKIADLMGKKKTYTSKYEPNSGSCIYINMRPDVASGLVHKNRNKFI